MRIWKRKRVERERRDESSRNEQDRLHILSKKTNFYTKEAYKTLRTNIRFSLPTTGGCRKVCVTSAYASEGKSITTLNLAISFAESGQHTLLVDADLRRPNQGRLLRHKVSPGLSNVLANLCTEEEAIHKEIFRNLDVLFSGDIPPNPSELLGHIQMERFLARASKDYDYIFIDTPPVDMVTDACVLSNMLDGVLFVVREKVAEKDMVMRGINQLELAGANLLGFILNASHSESGAGYGGHTKYRYGYSKYEAYTRAARRTHGDGKELQERKQESQGRTGDNS